MFVWICQGSVEVIYKTNPAAEQEISSCIENTGRKK